MGLNSQASDGESISSDEEMDAVFIGRDDISDYNPEQLLPEPPEVIGRIREWLQPTAYDIAGGEYRRHLSSHVAGTGHWLTSSDAYQEWLNSEEHGLLWIKGIPGSGKSVMAASLIDELAKSHPGSPVLFFFFRQIIDANHEPRALLRDWMDQLLSYSPPLQKQLKTYVEAHRPLESVSLEDMWKHLRLAFASLPGKVFCVADALDEIDRGHDDFLRALGELGRWRPKTVKVLITGRPVASVEIPLRKTPCLHIRLQEALVDVDIATYVQFTLSRSSIPESVWKVIADAVPGRANGLFLYAKLAMDAFLEPGVDINAVLSRLPTDLNALYTDLLAEHSKRSGVPEDIQRLILQSVTHATRPLRLLELAEMIRISFRGDSTRDIKGTKDLIRAACGPLLEILPDETVSVIHHSFTEYLKGTTRSSESLQTGYPALHMGPAHAQLALQCVLYLQSGCLSTVALDTNEAIDYMAQIQWDFGGEQQKYERKLQDAEVQVRLQYPLFEYAASNWYLHIAKSEAAGHDQTEINAKLNELFDDGDNMKAWLQMRWPENSIGARKVTKLHIAAKSGLLSYTRELLGTFDADVADIYDRTPIWWAASEGHAEVISALLESSASPDMPDNYSGLKPLHMAASNNHAEAVTVLLEAGVDPLMEKTLEDPWVQCGNGDSSVGDSPLMYACHGHLEALEAFLPFIKDNLDLLHRALAWAVNVGASKNVALLLQQPGVDVNALVDGQTPLYRACEMVDDVQVAMLLRAGADSNIKCDVGDNAGYRWPEPTRMNCFYALCNQQGGKQYDERFQAVFPLLVQAGVDIHYRTSFGETALHAAVNSPVLLKLLLDAGLDANAADHEGATPLHYLRLASFPLMPAIELLVEQGHADINAATHDGQTPLHALIRMLEGDTLKRFLEYGADCRAADNKGNTPLHLLMQGYGARAETVKALLAGGADPNARNHDGLTPSLLCSYVDSGYMDILDAFRDFGADISAVDRNGNNLLFRLLSSSAQFYGDESHRYLKHVIDRGLSPFQRNYQGETALHQAVKHHDASRTYGRNGSTLISRLDFLLGFNLDVKAVDYMGNTLLHTLAMRIFNHSSYSGMHLTANWEHLLALGLDLEQKNHAGRTPLHYLCAARTHALRFMPGRVMPIDFVLSRVKDVNVPDIDGITPLHIAVTCGRLYAKKLIDAGAYPLVPTHEGLIPLHLAARCRDGNNVGLLLQSMRERQDATATAGNTTQASNSGAAQSGKSSTASHAVLGVNAKAVHRNETITPLYYACRSGTPEIVSLLLEAGADVSIGNLFEACFEFEEESALWKQPHPARDDGDEHEYRPPLKMADTYRQDVYDSWKNEIKGITSSDMARLEEIIDMLVQHGADTSPLEGNPGKYQEGLIKTAIAEHRDYTAACLKRALGKTSKGPDAKESRDEVSELIEAISHREKSAAVEALKASWLINTDTEDRLVPLRLVTRLLARREYHLVEELSRLGVSFLPKSLPKSRLHRDENCTLSHLIQMGFASIVERIGSLEAERRLKTGDWHAFGDNTRPGLWYSRRDGTLPYARPFIFDAVQRESPNMDILRLLVERFAVDINEVDDSGETALFRVARGDNWWQVHQALPYLLDAGADIHVRNANGQTPLHMALQANDDNENGPFNWDAAKILIERGADVNAVNGKGQSCLAYAQHNVDMVYFLSKHGAVVNVDSIFGAIESGNISVLRALLSGGIDPNTRRDVSSEDTDDKDLYNLQLEPQEVFPLYYSAMQLVPRWHATDNAYDEFAKRAEIVRTLLQHGANPFANCLKKDKEATDAKDPSAAQTPSIDVLRGYKECTLLHEVLRAGAIADVFFELPNLDVNHRDARGRTLLHMVCENRGGQDSGGPDHIIGSYTKNHGADLMERVTVFERLLALGADLEATDNFGRNVLHYMLLGEVDIESVSFRESMAYTLDKAPSLMNQPDGNGETPFHYAVIRAVRKNATGGAEMLLQAGADPTVVNNNGDTLLHLLGRGLAIAALRTLFETLVNRGLDINARNSHGETALFSFYSCPKTNANARYFPEADRPSGEHTKVLLEKLGGDFFARDNRGRGLLHVAAGGDVERFQELMELGLDVMAEDDAQQTAIDVAAACGNREILEIFEKKKD